MIMKKGKLYRILTGAVIVAFVFSMQIFIGNTIVYAEDEFDNIRNWWVQSITGGPSLNISDPDIAAKLSALNSDAQSYWDSMDLSSGRTYIFPDAPTKFPNSNITSTFTKLRTMACAYTTLGGSLYHNQTLESDIISALDWVNQNWYNKNEPYGIQSVMNSWYDWEIGCPLYLTYIIALLYNDLTSTQIANYCDAMDHFNTDPKLIVTSMSGKPLAATGANLAWKVQVIAQRSIIKKDGNKLIDCRDALSPVFDYTTFGDGFYTDGSCIQHGNIPYASGYGYSTLETVIYMMRLLNGTSYAIIDIDKDNTNKWIYDSYEPLVYKNRMFNNVAGRYISRFSYRDHATSLINSVLYLSEMAPSDDASRLKSMVKYYLQSDGGSYYQYGKLSLITTAKNIVNDAGVQSRGDLLLYKQFPNMDRAVQTRPDYGFSVSMYSSRIRNYEAINLENLKGWFTGYGMTSLYTSDLEQYHDPEPNEQASYWVTIDPYRLPGTTVNHGDDSDAVTPQLGQVTLQGSATIVDDLNDWSKTISHTYNLAFDTQNPQNYEGDTSRVYRTCNTIEQIEYECSALTGLSVKAYYNTSTIAGKIYVYTSPNHIDWKWHSTINDTPVDIGGGWKRANISISDGVPEGTNYILIEVLSDYACSANDKDWVGGTDIEGLYGVTGMELRAMGWQKPNEATLTAKKSWFMFDNEIVALGSGISSNDGKTVETIVDNRKLGSSGNEALTVNGTSKPSSLGWEETMIGTNWVHLAGNTPGSDIGYYFPGGATINAKRETRTGSWATVNHSNGTPTDLITRNYLTMWLDHGTAPSLTSDTYSYVILPDKINSEVSSYASNPDITILENSADAQAVKENTLNITAVNFWNDIIKRVDTIKCNRKASVITREISGDKIEVSVSDPTMKNTGYIDVEIVKSATGYNCDPEITVYQTSPTIRFLVHVDGAKGKSFKANFNISETPWPDPTPVPASAPQPMSIADNLDDWNMVYSHTANWRFDSSNSSNFEGDISRLKRSSDTPENVVYKLENISDFTAKIYYATSFSGNVKVYVSPDNETWIQLSISNDNPVATGGGIYRVNIKPSAEGIPGGMSYLKIEFLDDTRIWTPQLSQVVVKRSPVFYTVVDNLSTYTKAYSHSTGWDFDASDAQVSFEGDYSRLTRSSDTTQYIIYKYSKIVNFNAKVYYNSDINGKVNVYTSPDNVTWTQLPVKNDTPAATGGNWYKVNLVPAGSLPEGTNYLKLEFTNDSLITTPQLSMVSIDYLQYTDDLNNWYNVYSYTADWTFDTTNSTYFEGDTSRIKRKSNTPNDLVYYSGNGIGNFSAKVYYRNNIDGKVNVYTSPDGINWTQLSITYDTAVNTQLDWYRVNFMPDETMPDGIYYLKISFLNDSLIYTPQLSQITIDRPAYVETDNLDNWSKTYQHDTGLILDSSSPNYFEGDTSRVKRNTDSPLSLQYKYNNITAFTAKVYYRNDIDSKVNVYTSPDGMNWTQLSIVHDTAVNTISDWYRVNFTPVGNIPSGTNYIKIELLNDSLIYAPQLSKVYITHIDLPPVIETDDLNDWSKTYLHDMGLVFDSSSPNYFEGDTSRAKRSSNTPLSLQYKYNDITAFTAKVYYRNDIDRKVNVYTSPDGINWTQLPIAHDTAVNTLSDWYRVNYTPAENIPFGTDYIKIELLNDSLIYTPQLSKVELTHL